MLMQTQSRAVIRLNANSTRPAPAPGGLGTLELMASRMTFGPNDEIFGEDEPAEYAYKVVAGAVRTYKILKDGRRKIGAFYLPGDMFGLEAGGNHQFSAEAIDNATVLVIRRSAVISLAECDTCVARELWSLARRELHGVQEHMLLLAKSAQQRVASFLLEMSERLATTDTVELPMSRRDIGDYLGLTLETVSRTLAELVSAGQIRLATSRRVVLRDRHTLAKMTA